MKIVKSKKTCLVRRSLEPGYNQSFDIKLSEPLLGVTFLTVQLKQSRLFAVKGVMKIFSLFDKYLRHEHLRLDSRQRHHRERNVCSSLWSQTVGGSNLQESEGAGGGGACPQHSVWHGETVLHLLISMHPCLWHCRYNALVGILFCDVVMYVINI